MSRTYAHHERLAKREHKGHLCAKTGKRIFHSHRSALIRGAEILAAGPRGAKGFRSYKCEFCPGYHLTSQVT